MLYLERGHDISKNYPKKVPSGIFSLFLEVYFLMQSEEEEKMHHMAASFRFNFFYLNWVQFSQR